MSWQHIRIARFGGPEVLELAEQPTIPEPGSGEVRIKILVAGTGFTDSFIRRGRYPDFKGPLPFTPGYELVGVVDKTGPGVVAAHEGELVADLCVVGGMAATLSMRSAPRVSWCLSPMVLIWPKRCASRSPISLPFRCSPVTDPYRRVQRS